MIVAGRRAGAKVVKVAVAVVDHFGQQFAGQGFDLVFEATHGAWREPLVEQLAVPRCVRGRSSNNPVARMYCWLLP